MKVIFKVIKCNYRLPSARMDSEDEALTDCYANDVRGDGAESVG